MGSLPNATKPEFFGYSDCFSSKYLSPSVVTQQSITFESPNLRACPPLAAATASGEHAIPGTQGRIPKTAARQRAP